MGKFVYIGNTADYYVSLKTSRISKGRRESSGSKYIPLSYFVIKVTNFVFYKEGNFFSS